LEGKNNSSRARSGGLARAVRAIRRAFVLVVVAGLVLVPLAYLGRNRVVAPVLLRTLAPMLERSAGLSFVVGEVSGDWFTELAFTNVRVEATGEAGVLRSLTLDELRLRYALRTLLRGELDGLASVDARGVVASVDLTRGSRAHDQPPEGTRAPALPDRLPRVHIDGSVQLALDQTRTLDVTDLVLSVLPGLSTFRLDARVLETPLLVRGRWLPGARVEADIELPGAELTRFAGLLPAELELGGTVALDARAEFDVHDPTAVRARFTLEGRELAYDGYRAASLSTAGSLDELVLTLSSLTVDAGENTIRSGALTLPLASDDASAGLLQRLARTRARIDCVLRDVPALLPAQRGRAEDVPQHELCLVLELDDSVLSITQGTIETPGCSFAVGRGTLPLDLEHELDVELEADFSDLSELGALLRLAECSGRLRGEVVLRGTWAVPRGLVTLRGDEVLLAGAALGNVSLAAQVTETELRVSSLSADGALGHIDLTGDYGFETDELNATLALAIGDSLLAPAGLAGPLAVTLELSGTGGDVGFDIEATGPALSFSASGVAALDTLEQRASMRFDRLALDDGGGGLMLLRPARLVLEANGVLVDDLALAGPAGLVSVDLVHRQGATCGLLIMHDLVPPAALRPWLPEGLDFKALDARIALELEPDTIAASVTLELERLEGHGFAPLDVALDATLGGGWIDVRMFEAHGSDGSELLLAGRAPFEPRAANPLPEGELTCTGHILVPDALTLPGVPTDGALRSASLDAALDLSGTWSRLTGRVHLAAEDVIVEAVQLGAGSRDPQFGPVALVATIELGDELRIVEASAVGPGGIRATIDGSLAAVADLRAWVGGDIPGDITRDAANAEGIGGAALELDADVRVEDMSRLADLSPALRTLEGAAELVFSLRGTPRAPRAAGHLTLTGSALRTNTPLPAISELNAALTLADGAFEIERVAGELGGAPFELQGEVALWPPDPDAVPTVDITLVGENLLLYRMSGVRVRATSDLAIRGPLHAPLVSGTVALRDGRYVKDFELLSFGGSASTPQARRGLQVFSLRAAPYADLRFDVEVTSETPFRIDTNLTQGKVRPEIRLRGTGAVPLIEGTIYIDPMKVKLPSGPLRVRSGTLVFDESDPFLPTLELRADTRLRGYDIYLHVSGKYDEPEVDLTSSPSLPSDELLLLLLTGTPPTAAGRTDEDYKQGAQDVMFYLVRDMFGTISDSDDESWADRIEVTTGGEITRSGAQTTRASVRLFDEVFVEGDSISVIGERDVYDKINFGLQFLFRLRLP